MKAIRLVAIALAVLAVIAIGIAIAVERSDDEHVHAMYRIAVDGAVIPCAQPAVTRETFIAAHVHAPTYDLVHGEGSRAQATLANLFRHVLNGSISDDRLSVHVGPGCDGDHVANATISVVVLVEHRDRNWMRVPFPVATYHLEDHTRILACFGCEDSATIGIIESTFANATWDGP